MRMLSLYAKGLFTLRTYIICIQGTVWWVSVHLRMCLSFCCWQNTSKVVVMRYGRWGLCASINRTVCVELYILWIHMKSSLGCSYHPSPTICDVSPAFFKLYMACCSPSWPITKRHSCKTCISIFGHFHLSCVFFFFYSFFTISLPLFFFFFVIVFAVFFLRVWFSRRLNWLYPSNCRQQFVTNNIATDILLLLLLFLTWSECIAE